MILNSSNLLYLRSKENHKTTYKSKTVSWAITWFINTTCSLYLPPKASWKFRKRSNCSTTRCDKRRRQRSTGSSNNFSPMFGRVQDSPCSGRSISKSYRRCPWTVPGLKLVRGHYWPWWFLGDPRSAETNTWDLIVKVCFMSCYFPRFFLVPVVYQSCFRGVFCFQNMINYYMFDILRVYF